MSSRSVILAEALARARAFVEEEIVPDVPGLSVAVSVAGKMVWSEGFGWADWERKTPVTSATRFRVGSVAKPFTAAGLALLVERDQLDLDAPIQKYVPDFPDKGATITPRLLAGHLTGIRNYRGGEALFNGPFPNLRAGLAIFENDPLEAPPGTKFSYSSYNWNVLGVAMERAAGQDFPSYIEENVFRPLGLVDSLPDRLGLAADRNAQFYENEREKKFVRAPAVDSSYKWPSGGFLSTAEDIVRFGTAHLQPGFLRRESLDLLFTSQKNASGKPTGYGVGWFIARNPQGREFLFHGGDSIGGKSLLLLCPALQTVVGLACNVGHLTFSRANGRLALVKTGKPAPLAVKTGAAIAGVFEPVFAQSAAK